MKKNYFYKYLLVPLAALALASCNDARNEIGGNSLDSELNTILEKSSNGIGKAYYILPDSDDFSSIPQDPKNKLTKEKVQLGKLLFHETGLGQKPKNRLGFQSYSCASCHHAKAGFQACVPQGFGEGGSGFGVQGEGRKIAPGYSVKDIDFQPIRSPSAMNVAYQKLMLWNGQFGATDKNISTQASWTPGTPKAVNNKGFEGVESQAIAGKDVHRLLVDRIFVENVGNYKELFIKAFGENTLNNPTQLFDNGALAIAAYERTILANQAPFQQYLRGNSSAMTSIQKEGAKLFFGKANCGSCHNGPSLATMEFYALGMNDLTNGTYGINSVIGVNQNGSHTQGRAQFTGKSSDMYKFKVPQLYNLKDSPFYGHGASFTSVREVVAYKNKGLKENPKVANAQLSGDFKPLGLDETEMDAITDFLENALRDPNLERYVPEKLPSGLAFPNNDAQSRTDLGF
jgi:cytochrome c peroxidase